MKRDMELIRDILLKAEELAAEGGRIEIEERTHKEVNYHIFLMAQNGLILFWPPTRSVRDEPGSAMSLNEVLSTDTSLRIVGLTWAGHEFLDTARDTGTWRKALTRIGGGAASASFEVVKAVLIDEAKRRFGLSP